MALKLYGEKESNKKEEYHKMWVNHCMTLCIDNSALLKTKMADLYDYFHGYDENPYNSLFDAYNIGGANQPMTGGGGGVGAEGELVLPVIYMNISNIKNKVESLIGELIDMGFETHVEAINQEAKSRKLAMKQSTLAKMAIKPYMEYIEIESGFSAVDEEVPKTMMELEDFFKHSYKDNAEVVMEACLKYVLEYHTYYYMRLQLFLDALIAGECHALTDMFNGTPIIERWNPLGVYYPSDVNDDFFLNKSNIIGNVYYATRAEVVSKYKLTEEEINIDLTKLQGKEDGSYLGVLVNGQRLLEPYTYNRDKLLVSTWYWMDEKKVMGLCITDKHGNETFEIYYGSDAEKSVKVPPNKEDGTTYKVERKTISVMRKATLIGCDMLKDWGECQYQCKYKETIYQAQKNVCSYRPNYLQGRSKSLVNTMSGLQDFKNYMWTKIQLELTKSGGNAVAIDVAKLPQDWGSGSKAIQTLMYYMKGNGIVFYNSSQGEIPGQNGVPIDNIDTGLGNAIVGYISLLGLIDQEMDSVSGINDARMGNIQSANQLASVTAMALSQSNKVTKSLINGFLNFEGNLFTKVCQLIRHSWTAVPERWQPIIGDLYMLFLENDDYTMDEFLTKAKSNVISKTQLNNMLMAGLQTGSITAHEALKLQLAADEDIKGSVRTYIDTMERKENAKAQQEAQMQQAGMEAQLQAQQMRDQSAMQMQQQRDNTVLQERQMKDQTDLTKTGMKEGNKRQLEEQKMAIEQQDKYPLYTR